MGAWLRNVDKRRRTVDRARRLVVFGTLAFGSATPSTSSAADSPQRSRRRVGVLARGSSQEWAPDMAMLKSALRERGWNDDLIVFTERWDNDQVEALPSLALELVALEVDLIVAFGESALRSAMRATKTIPILILNGSDLVAEGFVDSLRRPGGNVTGISTAYHDMFAKELALLKEAIPSLRRVGFVLEFTNPTSNEIVRAIRATGGALQIDVVFIEVRPYDELEKRLNAIAGPDLQALMGWVGNRLVVEQCIAFGLAHGIVLADYTDQPPGLLSLEVDELDLSRRAAFYVDRILRGAKPADLPVEQPTRFKLKLNLRTARQFGIRIPAGLRLRADEIIQ